MKMILNPRSPFVRQWNEYFALSCLVALFVDPLFFYLPTVDGNRVCVKVETKLALALTILRTCTATLYLLHMFVESQTAFIAPSILPGRGVLVLDPREIASRYLMKNFWLDVINLLPPPQLVIWVFIPLLKGTSTRYRNKALQFTVFVQYLPRLLSSRLFPLTSKMVKASDEAMEIAWAGAAYNLILYIFASHVVGAWWYLFAVERQNVCWREFCLAADDCHPTYFDCSSLDNNPARVAWLNHQTVDSTCSPTPNNPSLFNYELHINALTNNITTTSSFLQKFFYCLWFGILNLSSLGQTLQVSSYIWEIIFAIAIVIFGFLLFAVLIGNIQTYLQSLTVRRNNKRRVRHTRAEQWMRHRQLPGDLRERIRLYDQCKWVATTGIDEESILQSLPQHLRRDIKRHMCLELVRRVPLFAQFDDILLDYICERLKPTFSTRNTYIIREGDPVNEMIFIIRGHLDTADGGRTGFFYFGSLGPGDFCGEELLTWALDPSPSKTFPSSTRTVKTLVEVEAFALEAEDLKFVSSQFARVHHKQLQHTFRYYSLAWRSWAACSIQVTWRRYRRRKNVKLPTLQEEYTMQGTILSNDRAVHTSPSRGATFDGSRFAANSMRSVQRLRSKHAADMSSHIPSVPKPYEPDFSVKVD